MTELEQLITLRYFHSLVLPILNPHLEGKEFNTPDFHWELYESLSKDERLQLMVAPVGFAKSTILKIFALYEILKYKQDIYTLYVSSNFTKSAEHLGGIKKMLEAKYLQVIFNYKIVSSNEGEIIFMQNGNRYKIEATASSADIAGKNFEGNRPSLIIVDDLEDLEQANSKYRTDKLQEWLFTVLIARLPSLKEGRVRMINTVLSKDCLTNRILGKAPGADIAMYSDWGRYFYQALDHNEKSIWEERHPTELLLNEKLLRPVVFATNYMNEPLDMDSGMVKYADLRYWETLPEIVEVFIHADTTHTGKQTSDFFCIGAVGRGVDNNFYLLDFMLEKCDPEKQALHAINFYFSHDKVKKITYDSVSNDSFGYYAKDLARQKGLSLPLEGKKYPADKVSHFSPHLPHFVANRVIFPRSHSKIRIGVEQLLSFPSKNVHDDFVDMLSGCLDNFKNVDPRLTIKPEDFNMRML
jgi:predicted phage terminase large subunit-like protein